MIRKITRSSLLSPLIRSFTIRVFICIIIPGSAIAQGQNIRINADFPGGNILVDSIRDHTVYLRPDLRDTGTPWFYWYFSVKAESSDSIRFVFTRPNCMTVKGPAVSVDQGKTWSWLFERRRSGDEFTYFVRAGQEVRFSMGMPYTQQNFDAFIQPYKSHPSVALDTLCNTVVFFPIWRCTTSKMNAVPEPWCLGQSDFGRSPMPRINLLDLRINFMK